MNKERLNGVQKRHAVDHVPHDDEPLLGDNIGKKAKTLIQVHNDEERRPRRVNDQEDGILGENGHEIGAATLLQVLVVCTLAMIGLLLLMMMITMLLLNRLWIRNSKMAPRLHSSIGEQGEQVEYKHAHERNEVAHGNVDNVGAEVD